MLYDCNIDGSLSYIWKRIAKERVIQAIFHRK